MSAEPVRHLFTVEEYHQMGEIGLFPSSQRLELLEGEVIEMAPIGSRHAAAVNRLTQLFVLALGGRVVVGVQNPVRLSNLSEPQPDLTLLQPRSDYYEGGHPTPDDVLLLIEVSDTTASWDRTVKRRLYSAAGIAETWIIDLGQKVVEIATDPGPEDYRDVRSVGPGGIISPIDLPDLVVATADLLG